MKDIAKRLLVICGVVMGVFVGTIGTCSTTAFANTQVFGNYTFTGGDCNRANFLGFVTWDCNVQISDQDSLMKTGVWMIASNVATDIAIAAAYLVLGYVIYGGYLYTFSGGDPNKVATGKKTLTQAFIGLAIAMCASIIMSAIRIALVGGSGNIGSCASAGGCVTPNEMVEGLVGWVTGIAGVVSAVFLVSGGIQYVTSAGDPNKLKRAKDTILYSLIGLAIVALATIITAFVSGTIRNASTGSLINNNVIISKEVYENQVY